MDIILVTSIMNDDIHGTDNDKKTGCGINLQKGDNINKYRRGGKMTDLKEVTCERCKNAFAKKMIKADKKEMARLLKEEKQREKAGLADEGIVPLGGTVAKITSVAPVAEPEPIPVESTPVPSPEPEAPKQTISGTGVALDSSLAAFNITPPPAEKPEPQPQKDDFMAQFAVKPQPEEKEEIVTPAPAPTIKKPDDDFLAQFAIPAPNQNQPEEIQSVTEEPEPEESIDFSEINPPPSAYEEPVELPPVADERPVGLIDEDDIMKMFAFGNVKASSSQSPAVDNSYNYVTPAPEENAYTPEPVTVSENTENEEFTKNADFDYVANKLFGIEEPVPAEPEEPEEMTDIELPSVDNITPAYEERLQEAYAPAFDDIELPPVDNITPAYEDRLQDISVPALDDIELPSADNIIPAQEERTQEVYTAAFDDIELPQLEDVAPVQEEVTPEIFTPELDDIEVPEIEESEPVNEYYEPVRENTGVPSLDDMALLMEQEESAEVTEEYEEVTEEVSEQPVYPEQEVSVQPVTPQVPPVQPTVQPIPSPVQPAYPQQPVFPQQPIFPQQNPYAQQPMIGQVVSVPQFKGYDQNNQPVYMYVQMQMTGYSPNGQPIYMPFGQSPMQQPVMQQPVMQQPFAQPAPTVAPVPQTPVTPSVPRNDNQSLTPGQKIAAAAAAKGGMPASAANISKIAVHEHSRSTSQVFINAIAESKEYANKSLTETQGNQARNMPVLDSIEDMLSAMGDNSEKEKRQKQESMKKNVPVYQEYTGSSNQVRTSQSRPKKSEEPQKPLTKAELREKKKQDKIDAKFKKDLAKKGF